MLKRTQRHFKVGRKYASMLVDAGIVDADVAETAIASCRFTVQGPESVGQGAKNWGSWIRTNILTYGKRPNASAKAWQNRRWGAWSADSHAAADTILAAFGMSLDEDVFAQYGDPTEGVCYSIDLVDLLEPF